jgi:TonB-linked SusC/RagA family outer membrane protein
MIQKFNIWPALLFAGILLAVLFSPQKGNAQTSFVLTGVVKDSVTGVTLPSVIVYERNKDNRLVSGVVSDINGKYQIKIINGDDMVVFKLMGYTVKTVPINGRQNINVSLGTDVKMLGGVEIIGVKTNKVNTGIGLDVPVRNRADATKAINMSELENIPAVSVDQLLEGKAAGLQVSMNSGDMGAGSSIQIRGAASIGLGSKPLFVVDDIPIPTNVPTNFDPSNMDQYSELVNINPSDIASITILKDAAACALYGADGANGVIVITTKRGDNIKPRVSFTSALTYTIPQKPIPLLTGDQYKTIILEEYQNRYNMDPKYNPTELFLNPGDPMYENFNNNTYWPDQVNRKGLQQNYNASVIGGGESATYNVSLGYSKALNTTYGSDFRNITGRFNFDYKVSTKLRFVSDFSYSNAKTNTNYNGVGGTALIKAPIMPIYTQDLSGNSLPQYFIYYNGFQGTVDNPLATANLAKNTLNSNQLDSKITAFYNPIKGLKIQSILSISYSSGISNKFLPHSTTGTNYNLISDYSLSSDILSINTSQNSGYRNPTYAMNFYQSNMISYTFDLGPKNTLMALVNTIYNDNTARSVGISSFNSPSEYIMMPSSSMRYDKVSSVDNQRRSTSLLGQLYYMYDDRYIISGILRQDGNSAFGVAHRFGTFPSASASWRPSSEPFLKNHLKWIDNLQVKGSWGIKGRTPNSDVLNQASYMSLSSNAQYIDVQGITPDNIELAGLRWEKVTETNIGLVFSSFKGLFSFELNRSNAVTRDMIVPINVPGSSGYSTMYQNFGTLKTNGYELDLSTMFHITKDIVWFTSFNISAYKNKVVELPGHQPVYQDKVIDNGKYMTFINEGDPTGSFYGLKYKGVYSSDDQAFARDVNGNFILDAKENKIPMRWSTSTGDIFKGGDAIYEDLNHDGLINAADVTYLGNANPQFTGGFYFRLAYKLNWQISSNFTYNYGNQIENIAMMQTTAVNSLDNQSTAVLRRWRQQGDITDQPRAILGMGHNFVGSDRYIQDGSFLRCDNIALSYNFSPKLISKIKLTAVRLTFSVNNVYTWTKYPGVDPTISLNLNNPFVAGRDNSRTPIPIRYMFGTTINF